MDNSKTTLFATILLAAMIAAPATAGARISLEVEDGVLQATSNRRVGLQASAGLDIPLGEVLSFSPAIRYQAYRAEFEIIDDALVALRDVGFLSLDFGLHIHPSA